MMCFGVGKAFVQRPGVQLVVVFEAEPRGEEPFARQSHLGLDLPFFPASGGRVSHWLDEITALAFEKARAESGQ
jgi:hypothetical protein